MKKRIAVDMDEVIADVYTKYLDIYEAKYGRRPAKEEYWGKKMKLLPGAEVLRPNLFEKGFFRDLPIMENSQEVLRELHERFDIYIVTAAMEFRSSFEDKYDWLQEHFPFLHWRNFVFCGDKSIIKTDWLIDDHVHNLETFTGTPIVFTASHNIAEERFDRVDNWLEVREYFKDIKSE